MLEIVLDKSKYNFIVERLCRHTARQLQRFFIFLSFSLQNDYMALCVRACVTTYNENPYMHCIPAYNGKSLYAFLRTKENPYTRYCVQRKIPICVIAYNGKSLYALLRTMENHQPKRRPRTAASRENPQSKFPDRRRPAGKIPNPNPDLTVD